MTRWVRRVAVGSAAATGAVVGVLVTLALSGPGTPTGASAGDRAPAPTPAPPAAEPPAPGPAPPATAAPPADRPATLLVWTAGGLPPSLAGQVATAAGVDGVTVVRGDQAGMLRTTDPAGEVVDAIPDGWQVPLDVLAVEPASFAPFVADGAAGAVAGLAPGQGLLTESSAALRRVGVGATIELATGPVEVAGVIDDRSGAGAELLVHAADAGPLGVAAERYLLIAHTGDREALQRAVADVLGGRAVRFRSPSETAWLRHGDAVAPLVVIKHAYGEFAYRDRAGRDVEVDPAWEEAWIVTEPVPVLGPVRCHRRAIGSLRAAMAELEQANLAHLVDPAAFAGCYAPRRIAPGQPLSHHAWGAAVDVNVDGNPRGSFSTQDQRLVDTMGRHGWSWGGTWLVPDPAHYEAPTAP